MTGKEEAGGAGWGSLQNSTVYKNAPRDFWDRTRRKLRRLPTMHGGKRQLSSTAVEV